MQNALSSLPHAACYSGYSVSVWHAYEALVDLNLETGEVQVLGCPALKQSKLVRPFIFPKPPHLGFAGDRMLHWSDPREEFVSSLYRSMLYMKTLGNPRKTHLS